MSDTSYPTIKLCNEDCNHCPIIMHPNSRMLTYILNKAYDKFGDEFYKIVEYACPNFTCCHDCNIDDFVHVEGCEIMKRLDYDSSPTTKIEE